MMSYTGGSEMVQLKRLIWLMAVIMPNYKIIIIWMGALNSIFKIP